MKILGYGELSYYLFFPLVTPILSSLYVTISRSFASINKMNEAQNDNLYKHPLVTVFLFFISQALAGFLELISRKLQKGNTKKEKLIYPQIRFNTIHIIESIKPDRNRIDYKLYLTIFGLVIVETTAMCIACLLFVNKQDVLISQLLAFQMVCSGFFSYPILNYKIYKHQIVALGMFLFGIGTIALPTLLKYNLKDVVFILGLFAGIILWSFQSVTAKYLMETKFISQFIYLFLHGLIGTIIIGVFLIFTPYIPYGDKCLEDTWATFSWIFSKDYIVYFIFLLIVTCAYNTFQLTTIKLFTPTHNDATESLGSLISWIYMAYIDPLDPTVYSFKFILPMQIFGYLLMIVASLMYNEIIIVYLCSLSEFTKKEIIRRSEENDKEIRLSLMEQQLDIL